MDLHKLSVRNLSMLLEERSVSAAEMVSYYLDRIAKHNPKIGAFVAINEDLSLKLAQTVDAARAAGLYQKPLAGIPFGVKDLENCEGFPTTKGSLLYKGARPATTNSLLVQRLRSAGAIPIGKTNTPEFGWKSTTENALFGATRNPYDTARTPGGSSGGTAAAVASGLVPFGTSSDGGGSIRIPASACGIAGLKPSTGRIAARGEIAPNWWDLTTSGPMARTFSDTAWLYDFCVGPHIDDLRSLPQKTSDWAVDILDTTTRPRVGLTYDMGYGETDSEIRGALQKTAGLLSNAGYPVVELPPLFSEPPFQTWIKIAAPYNARTLGIHVGTPQFDLIEPGLGAMILDGMNVLARDFISALDEVWTLSSRFFSAMSNVDLLLCPTTATLAPIIGENGTVDGVETGDWVGYTSLANLTRTPAASVCVGISKEGIPISIQIMGKRFSEVEVLQLCHFIESRFTTPFPKQFF